MNKVLMIVVTAHVLTWTSLAFAYKTPTHRLLSFQAVERSILKTDRTILEALGLKPLLHHPNDEERPGNEKFPNSNEVSRDIFDLVSDGSIFEDEGFRALGHFYNPLTGEDIVGPSLFAEGVPSPDWALEDRGERTVRFLSATAEQEDSYAHTRQFFLNALTKPTAEDRRKQWGRTFQGLGQVIHHLQDMAQPQHARLDNHFQITQNGTWPFENPSLYEHFSLANDVSLVPWVYAPVYGAEDTTTFTTPRRFWDTEDGKGIAEYTHSGFVSAGTNFDHFNPAYPLPELGSEWAEDKTALCDQISAQSGVPLPTGPAGQKLPCLMTFIRTHVQDHYRPEESRLNNKASTYSIFDPDLKKFEKHQVYTLNSENFAEAHTFLIPRAIGYSAGLLNYFFRGKIDLLPDTDVANPGGYLLQNLGEEEMSGTFTLYYDDVTDTRHAWRVWTTPGPLPARTGQFSIPAFALPGAGDPTPKYPGQYLLVFTGQLGQETEAVAAKMVSAAASGLILTAGGDASGFARPGDGGAVTIETGVNLTPTAPATTSLIVPAGETLTLDGGVHHFSEIAITGTLELTADTVLQSDGPVGISGTIEGHDEREGIPLTIESGEVIALSGTIDVSGRSGIDMGSGDQPGGNGGGVTLRTASAEVFSVPTIITRGGDAALTDQRDPAKTFLGGAGGAITITTNSAPDQLALRFVGTELPVEEVDPLPPQQGAHTLPSTTTFRRGLLTTGGYGGQFKGPTGELGVTVAGTPGGAGGDITLTCSQPSPVQFDQTDLFTGGNLDVLLRYTRQVVFANRQTPRLTTLFQRTGSLGGQGSSGQTHTHGGNGGKGGAAGTLTMTNCELATPPASFTTPPRVAPLILGGNPVTGLVTTPRPRLIEAFATTGARLYTLQAFGGAGGMPGGSGLSLARCSATGAQCYTDGPSCPLGPNGTAQICLPVSGGTGRPGDYGSRGADGPVSCGPLFIPATLVGPGLVCQ